MILDEGAVRELLHMEDLIPAMARALADLSSGKVVQPMRTMIPIADHDGFLGLMPAYGGALGASPQRSIGPAVREKANESQVSVEGALSKPGCAPRSRRGRYPACPRTSP